MELFSVSLKGYRRFKSKSTLRTNGKLLALVGPNEAGKSSILDALHSMNSGKALPATDVSYGTDANDLQIVARFLLDDVELGEARLPSPSWLNVHKEHDGQLSYNFTPMPSDRDISHRDPVLSAIQALLEDDDAVVTINVAEADFSERLLRLVEDLATAKSNLTKQQLNDMKAAQASFRALSEFTKGSPDITRAAAAWTNMVELEQAPSPLRHAIDALHSKVPTFLLFNQAARQLDSSYSVDDLRGGVPTALTALFEAAKLDFVAVLAAIDANNGAEVSTLERRANRALEAAFKEAWRQSGITVALRLTPALVEVHVVNEDERSTRLAERSDGLRQFVALHAFASQAHVDQPILLIDEAEQRLHYDAQADLVQMLINQKVASKVIYTTHSAGCLPEDLGHGVRLVQPAPDESSTIVNKFWAEGKAGVAPLLFGMGAATLAFFPTRRAVCVEGPADMLLYPIMFREVLGRAALGFQFVPGLSTTARTLAPIVPTNSLNVTFLTDGDEGGQRIGSELGAGGIPPSKIIVLEGASRRAVEIEDFVDPSLLLDAANALITRFHQDADQLARSDLPSKHRMDGLEKAFLASTSRKIDKVELAYSILDLLDKDPRRGILDERRRADLRVIAERVCATFIEPADSGR